MKPVVIDRVRMAAIRGISRGTYAVRAAVVRFSGRKAPTLAAEVAALAADPVDRAELEEVAAVMRALRPETSD